MYIFNALFSLFAYFRYFGVFTYCYFIIFIFLFRANRLIFDMCTYMSMCLFRLILR